VSDSLPDDLRALADWLEARPEVPRPTTVEVYTSAHSTEDFKETVRAMGSVEKKVDGSLAHAIKRFGSVTYELLAVRRLVCTRRVVGTRMIEKPDPEAVIPTIKIEEEVVEWTCEPWMKDNS
jgi:hypothetical protein